MAKKLFVGSLSYSTNDQSLSAAFSEFGPVVSAKVIVDRDTGRSKGFGFVEFETADGASAALSGLNGQELDGRTINVSEARERAPRDRDRKPRGGGGGYQRRDR